MMKTFFVIAWCSVFLVPVSFAMIEVSEISLVGVRFFVDDQNTGEFAYKYNRSEGECQIDLGSQTFGPANIHLTRISGGPTPGEDYYIARTTGTYTGYLVGPDGDDAYLVGTIGLDNQNRKAIWAINFQQKSGYFQGFKMQNCNTPGRYPEVYRGHITIDAVYFSLVSQQKEWYSITTQEFAPNYVPGKRFYDYHVPNGNCFVTAVEPSPAPQTITKYTYKFATGYPTYVCIIPEWHCVAPDQNSAVYFEPNILSWVKISSNFEEVHEFEEAADGDSYLYYGVD